MSYIRLSLMKAQPGQDDRVRRLLDELVMFHEGQPGYLTGYRIEHTDGSDRVGRLAIWEHPQDADRVAILDHDIALRSELQQSTVESAHEEHAMYGHWAPEDGAP